MTCRRFFLLAAILLVSAEWCRAEAIGAPVLKAPRLLATLTLVPLSPSLTTLACRLPFSSFSVPPPLARLEAELWFLADSPYVVPRSYLELGLALSWALVDGHRSRLTAGLGTALGLETTAEGFVYGAGAGATARLAALFRPFPGGFLTGLGVGYGLLSDWDGNPWGQSLQLDLHAGYA